MARLSKLVALLLFAAQPGCVETAECDETVSCESGRVCYDYTCRLTCQADSDCRSDESCLPCAQDDVNASQDHCFGRTINACIPKTSS